MHCEDVNLNVSEQGPLASTMKLVHYFTSLCCACQKLFLFIIGDPFPFLKSQENFCMSVLSTGENILLSSLMNH
jgi:hypothetical protein